MPQTDPALSANCGNNNNQIVHSTLSHSEMGTSRSWHKYLGTLCTPDHPLGTRKINIVESYDETFSQRVRWMIAVRFSSCVGTECCCVGIH